MGRIRFRGKVEIPLAAAFLALRDSRSSLGAVGPAVNSNPLVTSLKSLRRCLGVRGVLAASRVKRCKPRVKTSF